MFAHVRKWFPWRERARRKKEFLDKLKGAPAFKVSKHTPVGAMFMLSNKNTGCLDSYFYTGDNRWAVCGTGPRPGNNLSNTFTARQLEMHLTKLVREFGINSIHILGENRYLSRIKPS